MSEPLPLEPSEIEPGLNVQLPGWNGHSELNHIGWLSGRTKQSQGDTWVNWHTRFKDTGMSIARWIPIYALAHLPPITPLPAKRDLTDQTLQPLQDARRYKAWDKVAFDIAGKERVGIVSGVFPDSIDIVADDGRQLTVMAGSGRVSFVPAALLVNSFATKIDSILESGHWQVYKGDASFIIDRGSVKRFTKNMGLKSKKRHKNG